MNTADFTTAANGFPLESDATLGFMQSDYQAAIRALAKLAGTDNIILTGLEIADNEASDGWILRDGDLVFFEGGPVESNFIIQETVVQKANQDGNLYDRYTTKKALFGTGTGQTAFSVLTRIQNIDKVIQSIGMICRAGDFQNDWIILDGLEPLGNGVGSGLAIYSGRLINVPVYDATTVNDSNPVYLTTDGEWKTTDELNSLRFDPKTNRRFQTVFRNAMSPQNTVMWFVGAVPTGSVDIGGLGIDDWEGWAYANGQNGTQDLTSAITGLVALQRL